MIAPDKRVYHLSAYPTAALRHNRHNRFDHPVFTAEPREHWTLVRYANGTTANHLMPRAMRHRAIPLEMHWRKRHEQALEPGAVWVTRNLSYSTNAWVSNGNEWLRYISTDGGHLDTTERMQLDPDLLTTALNEGLRRVPQAVHTRRLPDNPHGLTHAVYCGVLPEPYKTSLLSGGTLLMESHNTNFIHTETSTGPRVQVFVHNIDLDDIDPLDASVETVRSLKLDRLDSVQDVTGIQVDQLTPGDETHERLARCVLAYLKPGYINITPIPAFQNSIHTAYLLPSAVHYPDRPIFPHVLDDEEARGQGLIGYYDGAEHLIRGRVTRAKPGKFLRKFDTAYSDESIKQIVNNVQMDIMPSRFELVTDPARIVNAFVNGPNSCMTKPTDSFAVLTSAYRRDALTRNLTLAPNAAPPLTLHPTAVYGGDSDTACMVLYKGDAVVARAVVNTATMKYPRVYSREGTTVHNDLVTHLAEQGYSPADNALAGATVRTLTLGDYQVKPYFDVGNVLPLMRIDDELSVLWHSDRGLSALSDTAKERLKQRIGAGRTVRLPLYNNSYDAGAFNRETPVTHVSLSVCGSCDRLVSLLDHVYDPSTLQCTSACDHCRGSRSTTLPVTNFIAYNEDGQLAHYDNAFVPLELGGDRRRISPIVSGLLLDSSQPDCSYATTTLQLLEAVGLADHLVYLVAEDLWVHRDEVVQPLDADHVAWVISCFAITLPDGTHAYLKNYPSTTDAHTVTSRIRATTPLTLELAA